jgi:dienelactone hydrolase
MMSGRLTRRSVLGAGALSALVAIDSSAARAANGAPPTAFHLPPPSGHFDVGTKALHLVDHARLDPFATTPQPREVMAQAWYPARSVHGAPRARYLPPAAAAIFEADGGFPAGLIANMRLDAHRDASPHPEPHGFPVVVFSPGLGLTGSSATTVVTDLASHGYVVVTLDHPYDSLVVEFPDGRLVLRSIPEDGDPSAKARYVATRAADARFVVGQLEDRLGPVADLRRAGMFGHSIGGATTAQVLGDDHRFHAGIDLDGSVYEPAASNQLHRPFMLVGGDYHHRGNDHTWAQFWAGLTGWRRDLGITGMGHLDFTDYRPFMDQLGGTVGFPPELFGPLDGARALDVTRAYVRAFFDRHLAGRGGQLVERPSASFPEVTFRG